MNDKTTIDRASLNERDRKILGDVGVYTLAKVVKKWWGRACPNCKSLAMQNPKGDMSQYCQQCQDHFLEIAKQNVKL